VKRGISAILFGGTLRATPLREAIGCPTLALPIDADRTLADVWLERLIDDGGVDEVRSVLNSSEDVDAVIEAVADHRISGDASFRGLADPASWRGAGGIVYDVTRDMESTEIVIVAEGHRLPPMSLQPVLDAFSDATIDGVVGVCGQDEPAGVYAFRRHAVDTVSDVGYCDLKEQMLPALREVGHELIAVHLGPRPTTPIRDRSTYLRAVREALRPTEANTFVVASSAQVDSTALLDGICLLGDRVTVDAGAVVHNAILLPDAFIGAGAVVSESVVGPAGRVETGGRLVAALRGAPHRPDRIVRDRHVVGVR